MSSSESDDDESYGPALPPHMLAGAKKQEPDEEQDDERCKGENQDGDSRGRSGGAVIGPSLPPGFNLFKAHSMTQPDEQVGSDDDDDDDDDEQVDPASRAIKSEGSQEDDDDDDDYDDDDIVGPFPPDHPKALARSAYRIPRKEESGKPKREEWMLIPPKNKPISGLAARKFLPRSLETRNDDNDDAQDNDEGETNEKQDLKEHFQAQITEKRDELMSNLISESGSGSVSGGRSESLLEIHRKNMKRKLEEERKKKKNKRKDKSGEDSDDGSKKERRPFDRDNDLKISGLSGDDKERFIKRASTELQGRFAHGKKAGKFL